MKVQVKTKSNFRNLNGQWLELKEIVGTRVTCTIPSEMFGSQTIDFTLSEVVKIDTTCSNLESK
jgi:phage major head subunit gpT-like protein